MIKKLFTPKSLPQMPSEREEEKIPDKRAESGIESPAMTRAVLGKENDPSKNLESK